MDKQKENKNQALYRAYRPQNFDEIIGQEYIVKILKSSVAKKQLSHSYLFIGSRGTGKTSMARILAKAVNCLNPREDGNPCGKCENCIAIQNGNFMDLIEIDAASNRGIDQIRELKERIEFRPAVGKYKVYIIDEVHMMTTEAFNALLKTLEEPPAHIIFILATTEAHKIPATILSRCQRHDFKLGSSENLKERITSVIGGTGFKFTDGAIDILIKNSGGSYRDALSLLEAILNGSVGEKDKNGDMIIDENELLNALGIPLFSVVEGFLSSILDKDSRLDLAFETLYKLDRDGVNIAQLIKSSMELLRSVFIYKSVGDKIAENYSFDINKEFILNTAKYFTVKQILDILNFFIEADREVKNAPIPLLMVEIMIVKIFDSLGRVAGNEIEKNESHPEKKKAEFKITEGSEKIVKKFHKEEISFDDKTSQKAGKIESDDCNCNIHKDVVMKGWGELKKSIKAENSRLYAILEGSEVVDYSDGCLKIQVAYNFGKEILEMPKTRELIISFLENFCSGKVRYNCEVNSKIVKKMKKDPASMGIVFETPVANAEKNIDGINNNKGNNSENSIGKNVINRDDSQNNNNDKITSKLNRKSIEQLFAGL